jgi:hypothetical protein
LRTFAVTLTPVLAALLVSACGEPPPTGPAAEGPAAAPSASGEASPPLPAAVASEPIEGWDNAATSLLGKPLPGVELSKTDGSKMQAEDLRGRWTVVALWSASNAVSIADETYIRSVISAADQDPDLDFVSVHVKTDAAADPQKLFKGNPWPTVLADDKAMQTFGVSALPAYLLVGPDLTIEASRGALSKTPDNGIKDMFRGISEIRKQIRAP